MDCDLPDSIAAGFWRRNRWSVLADLQQTARLADLQAGRTFDASRGTPRNAYRRAAIRRAVWGALLQDRAPVSGSNRDALRELSAAPLSDCPHLTGHDGEWGATVRRIAGEVLAGEPVAARVLLLGERPREVAAATGCTVGDVYKATDRGRYRLRQSGRLQTLLTIRLAQHCHGC